MVDTDTDLFKEYLTNHDKALNFAVRNRKLIARRMLQQVSEKDAENPECLIDIHHNFMEKVEFKHVDALQATVNKDGKFPREVAEGIEENKEAKVGWLHRKGATPTTHSKILVIPGSRGTLSYLVEVNP
jgi:release factor H-coupled RctB family protein